MIPWNSKSGVIYNNVQQFTQTVLTLVVHLVVEAMLGRRLWEEMQASSTCLRTLFS